MESDSREKAKKILRKLSERFQSGGGFFDWTEGEREIWRQINALDPVSRQTLEDEVFKGQLEDSRRELNRLLESCRELLPDVEIPDPGSMDENSLFNRFECESCGRTMVVPVAMRSKDEVLKALEREKAIHREECTGPPHISGHG